MNHIGNRIKYYRIKNGLTQTELANGIISFSYLSKIENGNATPDPEIIELLCKRLNITPQVLTEYETDLRLCKKWFKTLLLGDKERSTELYKEIISNTNIFSNEMLINLIELNMLRYFILTNHLKNASEQLSLLERRVTKLNSLEQYYFYKFSGEYYFSRSLYQKAFEMFQQAERLISYDLFFKQDEESDLFYLIGLTASKIRQVHIAMTYATKALQYYQSQYNLYKCAQCHILLGISYRRITELEKAKQSYKMAIRIGKTLSNNKLVALSYQNMGALYSSIGESKKSIDYFNKAFILQVSQDNDELLTSIVSLVKEYYKIKDYANAINWLQKGLALTESSTIEKSIYTLDVKVYNQLLNLEYKPTLEKIILKEVIPFLEENNLNFQKHYYYQLLADYYYMKRRYKSAADYYVLANQTLNTFSQWR